MRDKRIFGAIAAAVSFAVLGLLYTAHPVKSSDHQDTYNLATRSNTSADITDVFVFPSPTNSKNVVFAMDTTPLIPAGMGTAKFFDPTLMWQFKISHVAGGPEDEVIQFGVSGTDATQKITMYGPAAPAQVGTTNTFIAPTGSATYNQVTTLANGIKIFAGPRADPFYIDLFAFFTFLGDRNYSTHTSQSDPGPGNTLYNGDNVGAPGELAPPYDKSANPNTPSFNGFKSGTLSGTGGYACSTNPATNTLAAIAGGFDVLSFVVEVPKSLLTAGYTTSLIHVWATSSSSSGT
jgi:hypothetical protein